jgi:diguanylate cyclase
VLLLDLNRFKSINDRYGHAAGDLVLKRFGERLNKVIRASDLPVRLGGDEFLVILPECLPEKIPALLKRLGRIEVQWGEENSPSPVPRGGKVMKKAQRRRKLIGRADKSLYANKRKEHAADEASLLPSGRET